MSRSRLIRVAGGRRPARAITLIVLLLGFGLACTPSPPTSTPTGTPSAAASPSPIGPAVAFDFGDAPDPPYPSLFASDGARTRVADQFWLGNLRSPSVDSEYEARVIDRDLFDDGLEAYLPYGGQTKLTFRAVKSSAAADGVVYFNLLVDFDRDGWHSLGDWVEQNRQVNLAAGAQVTVEVSVGALFEGTWIRAALTDAPVEADPSAGWDGTGEFVVGEIEDYYLPSAPTLTPPPPSEPPPTYTPTPSYTPSEEPTLTPSEAPTASPTPTFVVTGDFVVFCQPAISDLIHGESVTIGLEAVSPEGTLPERFRGSVLGGGEDGGGTLGVEPAPGEDGWSEWQAGASVTFTSTHVDPPARAEPSAVYLVFQSPSTTRHLWCLVNVTHTEASPPPTTIFTPTIRVTPEIVTLSLTGAAINVTGNGFTPNGPVTKTLTLPDGVHQSFDLTADSNGNVFGTFYLRPNDPKGGWTLVVEDRTTGATATTTFIVR